MSIQLYTLSLACFSERGIEPGDVVNYRPAMLPWTGRETLRRYLLVNCYYPSEQIRDLVSPLFEGGKVASQLISQRAAVVGTVLPPLPLPKIVKPLRYNLDLTYLKSGWYPKLNINDALNVSIPYQPFLFDDIRVDSTEPVAIFTDKARGRTLYAERRAV